MRLEFIEGNPENFTKAPVLISGESSWIFKNSIWLALLDENVIKQVFEIRHEFPCGPFKQADIIGNLIGVGCHEHYYLFDHKKSMNAATIQVDGYFGYAYHDHDLIYLADATGIICLDKSGTILWKNHELGIDGVVIHEFGESEIFGRGEWDPPGGWKDFVLDKTTGAHKKVWD